MVGSLDFARADWREAPHLKTFRELEFRVNRRELDNQLLPNRPRSGQGPLTDAKKRRALDNYAMVAAIDYYKKEWYVEDVHKTKGVLDLLLTHRVSGEVLRVEVKGSSKEAETVEVTRWRSREVS